MRGLKVAIVAQGYSIVAGDNSIGFTGKNKKLHIIGGIIILTYM
jgi:hypothetical protein